MDVASCCPLVKRPFPSLRTHTGIHTHKLSSSYIIYQCHYIARLVARSLFPYSLTTLTLLAFFHTTTHAHTTNSHSPPRTPSPSNMQSLQDMASLAKVSTEHLIEEIQRRLHCAGKQEKKTIFIGTPAVREGRREGGRAGGKRAITCMLLCGC